MCFAAFCVLVLGWAAAPSSAQQQGQPVAAAAKAQAQEEIIFARMDIAVLRQTLVTMGMDLTPAEMQVFWPLYREYRLAAAKLGDRGVAMISTFADNFEQLTDEAADKLLAEFVSVEQARANLKADFLPKFKTALPPRKVVRFYQIENKLDIALLADLTEQIPLAR
jgi:soluble lytic murein transglycosylase-like protein